MITPAWCDKGGSGVRKDPILKNLWHATRTKVADKLRESWDRHWVFTALQKGNGKEMMSYSVYKLWYHLVYFLCDPDRDISQENTWFLILLGRIQGTNACETNFAYI